MPSCPCGKRIHHADGGGGRRSGRGNPEFDDRGRALARAYVNNGGDIALHLAPGAAFSIGMIDRPDRPAVRQGGDIGCRQCPGIATSGRHGRSFSLGIADAATVLAATAAAADAAATVIANAVDLPGHPGITRRPARDFDPQSDLGRSPGDGFGCAIDRGRGRARWRAPPSRKTRADRA